ncbi:hypothetical protein HZB00_03620 [Candidatus Woesearchaeota archaeon]|nr:hypothetical protein [Candidatus Woesearchaeota archaeon]
MKSSLRTIIGGTVLSGALFAGAYAHTLYNKTVLEYARSEAESVRVKKYPMGVPTTSLLGKLFNYETRTRWQDDGFVAYDEPIWPNDGSPSPVAAVGYEHVTERIFSELHEIRSSEKEWNKQQSRLEGFYAEHGDILATFAGFVGLLLCVSTLRRFE